MALEDNIAFAHFCDSLDLDYPESGITRSNPGSDNDPNVNAGVLEFDDSNTETLQFANTSEYWVGGTGDITMAVRATVDTATYRGDAMLVLGDSGRTLSMQVNSGAGFGLMVRDWSFGGVTSSNTSVFSNGTAFTLVWKRDSGSSTIWVDGVDESDGIDDLGSRDFDGTYDDVFLGSSGTGLRYFGGDLEWAAIWTRALTDSEIQNNMNETDLKAAILSSSSIAPLAHHYRNMKLR